MTSSYAYVASGGGSQSGYAVNGGTVVLAVGGIVSGGVAPYYYAIGNGSTGVTPAGTSNSGPTNATSWWTEFSWAGGTNVTDTVGFTVIVSDSTGTEVSGPAPTVTITFNATGHA